MEILLVEYNDLVMNFMSDILTHKGNEVICTVGGRNE